MSDVLKYTDDELEVLHNSSPALQRLQIGVRLNETIEKANTGGGGGSDHKVFADSSDTVASTLDTKIGVGDNLMQAVQLVGSIRKLMISIDKYKTQVIDGDEPDFLQGKIVAGTNVTVSTVTTSGISQIKINASSGGGLSQVYHDSTLDGDGSSGDPLTVLNPFIKAMHIQGNSGSVSSAGQRTYIGTRNISADKRCLCIAVITGLLYSTAATAEGTIRVSLEVYDGASWSQIPLTSSGGVDWQNREQLNYDTTDNMNNSLIVSGLVDLTTAQQVRLKMDALRTPAASVTFYPKINIIPCVELT